MLESYRVQIDKPTAGNVAGVPSDSSTSYLFQFPFPFGQIHCCRPTTNVFKLSIRTLLFAMSPFKFHGTLRRPWISPDIDF